MKIKGKKSFGKGEKSRDYLSSQNCLIVELTLKAQFFGFKAVHFGIH